MKIKVNDTTYDGETQPIMVILDEQDKKNIANMLPECTKYCIYPDNMKSEDVLKWMEIEE